MSNFMIPMALYGIQGTRNLIWFAHLTGFPDDAINIAFVWDGETAAKLKLMDSPPPNPLTGYELRVAYTGSTIRIPPLGTPGNGTWGNKTLVPLSLADFDIESGRLGAPTRFTRKPQ